MSLFITLVALLSGAANPFQSATNAELNKQLQQPLWAGTIVYATGLLGMLLLQVIARRPISFHEAQHVPWWAWTGGLISIASTMAGLMLAQRLGSGVFTGLSLTASVFTSMLLDHFGLVGLKQHTASPGRLAGCALLVAGIWLVAKF